MKNHLDIVNFVGDLQNLQQYKDVHWEGSFQSYINLVVANPNIARTAYQRIADMILSYGTSVRREFNRDLTHYHFFDDHFNEGRDAVYGIDTALMKLVNIFRAAASEYGTEKRVILLHGPVGSAKSTICRLLKRGLERYSRTPEGALYSFRWTANSDKYVKNELLGGHDSFACPMHEEPLHVIPEDMRHSLLEQLNRGRGDAERQISIRAALCPPCRFIFKALHKHYHSDWTKIIGHVQVARLNLSEKDRIGIGTFQPKDEKNQDSTELTGDINYRKIAIYGSDSDPRAFNFDGEFNIANRGMIEFIEVLKLDVAFLYDLLGASQEHVVKPKKFAQTDIDEAIIGHTNEPEYRKLQNNEFMEALRDRTVKIDIPYITKWSEEVKIYKKDFNNQRIRGKHIAPHTLEIASLWAVLTRLEAPKKSNMSLLQKLKLYDGKLLSGYTEESIEELKKETHREGLEGISPRYIQDKISNALVNIRDTNQGCVNPFMVIRELEEGLNHHSLLNNEEQKKHYRELLVVARQEYEDLVKSEVQRALSAEEEVLQQLCSNYIDNVKAYTQRGRVLNRYTGEYQDPDERLMRSIEERIDIPESRKDDFRREIMNYIGALSLDGKQFDYKINDRLRRALELKVFEDQKDQLKLSSILNSVVDRNTQEKIDVVKSRLIKNCGYCEICSSDVLNFVASIFARGDVRKQS